MEERKRPSDLRLGAKRQNVHIHQLITDGDHIAHFAICSDCLDHALWSRCDIGSERVRDRQREPLAS